MFPKNLLMTSVAAAGLALSIPLIVHADSSSQVDTLGENIVYGGTPITSSSAVQASAWGGGQVADDKEDAFTSAGNAIQVETAGLYQGTQIKFNPVLQLGDLKADKTKFLQFIFSLNPSTRFVPTAQMGSTIRRASSEAAGGLFLGDYKGGAQILLVQAQGDPHRRPSFPPGYDPSRRYQPPQPGVPARPGGTADETSSEPVLPIKYMHVILEFSSGAKAELMRPVRSSSDDVQWLRVSIPLAAIPVGASDSSNALLKSIYIGSDSPASIDIGEIRTIDNSTPISAFAGEEMTVPADSSVTFTGVGDGGISALKFEWDFDSPDAFESEAEGDRVTHTFRTAGDYKVTLRVSDIDGLKSAATSTATVHVTAQ